MFLDHIGEECGIVGAWTATGDAGSLVRRALLALQHRGEESAGMAIGNGGSLSTQHGMGQVRFAFDGQAELSGSHGIGHVRYSTSGSSNLANAQPIERLDAHGEAFALAHNGNISTAALTGPSHRLDGLADTRLLATALASYSDGLETAMAELLPAVQGAYSLVALDVRRLYAVRDRFGFRPLCLGRTPDGGWLVASESSALDAAGARLEREVAPGEMLIIDHAGVRSRTIAAAAPATCSFEFAYFARPDSVLNGSSVYSVRHACGITLALESPADADLVVPVPDTARPAAIGFAAASGLPYGEALFRNNYVGRTFIKPLQHERRAAVTAKLNAIRELVADRRVVVVDDSIVRATSAREVVGMLRSAGAHEVHLRIASPPVRWPCFFGVDIRNRGELIAGELDTAQITVEVGADSLGYLSLDGFESALGGGEANCLGCFTGNYPDTGMDILSPAASLVARGRSSGPI